MRLEKRNEEGIAQLDSIFKQFGKTCIAWCQVMMYCTCHCQLTKLHRRPSLSIYIYTYMRISCREQAWLIKNEKKFLISKNLIKSLNVFIDKTYILEDGFIRICWLKNFIDYI